jgi:amidohydrolase
MKSRFPFFAAAAVTLISCPLLASPQSPQAITTQAVNAAVDRAAPAMIEVRHQVHQHPELSNREFETSKLVAERLRALGLEVQTGIAHTGVVAILKGAKPGPVVAVRSELDALPVTEDTDLPFKSTVRSEYNGQPVGVAHACGHDIHIAAVLGVATVLTSMRDLLRGTVMFIFQPAEESAPEGEEGGAKLMLKEGIFSKLRPDAVFALHVGNMDVGQIFYSLGPTASAATTFKIEFHGKQAHAAFPEQSVDPVVMASEAVMELQTIRSRNISPYAPAVLSITMIHAGVRNNIIPENASLAGTIRVFDDKVEEQIETRMKEIVDSIARGAGGSAQLDFLHYSPVLINDPALVKRMLPAVERAVGADNVHESPPVMASDDFAYFGREVPAFFFMMGSKKPGTISGINHAPNFRADDSAIPIAIRTMTDVLLEYLQTTPAR